MSGKSVAMQLKALSVENGLLAQCRIPSIPREFGIKDYGEGTANRSSMFNHGNQRLSSAFSEATDVSYNNTSNHPINRITSPMKVYQFDNTTMAPSSSLLPMELNTSFESTNDITTAVMTVDFYSDIEGHPNLLLK